METKRFLTKIVLIINWFGGAIFFHLLNWTFIYGKKNIPKEPGTLFVASHYTMVDSWLIGTCFNFFDIIFRTELIPYNVPEEKNFYKVKIIKWWLDHSKCIPINRAAGGRRAHEKIKEVLKYSNVEIFPGSERRRKGKPIIISASVGKLIYESGAKNITPIKLVGLPYKGNFVPVIFRRLKIIIGKPIIIPQLENPQNGNYKSIAQLIIDTIENLNPEKVK